jgi:hypothetical protein
VRGDKAAIPFYKELLLTVPEHLMRLDVVRVTLSKFVVGDAIKISNHKNY